MSQLTLRGETGGIGNGGWATRELMLERGERDMSDVVGGLVRCIRETRAQDAGKLWARADVSRCTVGNARNERQGQCAGVAKHHLRRVPAGAAAKRTNAGVLSVGSAARRGREVRRGGTEARWGSAGTYLGELGAGKECVDGLLALGTLLVVERRVINRGSERAGEDWRGRRVLGAGLGHGERRRCGRRVYARRGRRRGCRRRQGGRGGRQRQRVPGEGDERVGAGRERGTCGVRGLSTRARTP